MQNKEKAWWAKLKGYPGITFRKMKQTYFSFIPMGSKSAFQRRKNTSMKALKIEVMQVGSKSDMFHICTHFHKTIKVVLGGYHRILFRVKVKTVKLIGGRRYLAVIQMMAFTQIMVIWTPWITP